MTVPSTPRLRSDSVSRSIGRVKGRDPGPTLLVVAGIHGNEPAGLEAARRVLARINREKPAVRGDFVVLAGNLRALAQRRRFVDRDLNRLWKIDRVESLLSRPAHRPIDAEEAEQLELLESIHHVRGASRGENFFMDLHTTSAEGYPFGMIGDSPRQRTFALQFQLPIIVGLLDTVDGLLLKYMEHLGFHSFAVEGGQHESERSVQHHEAVLWTGLVAAGLLESRSVPDLHEHHDLLAGARGALPRLMSVVYRYAIAPEDDFKMLPGFANIHPVNAGELLARDRRGEIRAAEAGILFMPLYQGQGEDGFFFGRAMSAE